MLFQTKVFFVNIYLINENLLYVYIVRQSVGQATKGINIYMETCYIIAQVLFTTKALIFCVDSSDELISLL